MFWDGVSDKRKRVTLVRYLDVGVTGCRGCDLSDVRFRSLLGQLQKLQALVSKVSCPSGSTATQTGTVLMVSSHSVPRHHAGLTRSVVVQS